MCEDLSKSCTNSEELHLGAKLTLLGIHISRWLHEVMVGENFREKE